jgi:hypothetical protein
VRSFKRVVDVSLQMLPEHLTPAREHPRVASPFIGLFMSTTPWGAEGRVAVRVDELVPATTLVPNVLDSTDVVGGRDTDAAAERGGLH